MLRALQMADRPRAEDAGDFWKLEEARNPDLSSSLRKEHSPVHTLTLAQWDPCQPSEPYRCEILNLC